MSLLGTNASFEDIEENKFNSFDVKLFKKLCRSSDENIFISSSSNIFISPLSISLALSMLLLGSDGTTRQQLEKESGCEEIGDINDQLELMNNLLRSNSSSLQIKLANSVFPSKTFKMTYKYEREVERAFGCKIESLDYENDIPYCTKKINDWVAECTDGKINNLYGELKYDVACVLVSCIYFKGDWLDKFELSKTKDSLFFCTENNKSPVKMMFQKNDYLYRAVDESGFKCLKIPYEDPNFRMLIILPNKNVGLNDVINKLDDKTIESLKDDANFSKTKVLLRMPKFKIEYKTNLKETLRLLGIKEVF